jgi:hypothetical protein
MHMNMYLFFKNLNILCIFSDRFFSPFFPVPVRFRFLGSTGSVLVTSVATMKDSMCSIQPQRKSSSKRSLKVSLVVHPHP